VECAGPPGLTDDSVHGFMALPTPFGRTGRQSGRSRDSASIDHSIPHSYGLLSRRAEGQPGAPGDDRRRRYPASSRHRARSAGSAAKLPRNCLAAQSCRGLICLRYLADENEPLADGYDVVAVLREQASTIDQNDLLSGQQLS
jgi:hypothetical protein